VCENIFESMGGTICFCDRKVDQVGKAILWLPWFVLNRVLYSLKQAEDIIKRPPNMMEIFITMKKFYSVPIKNCYDTSKSSLTKSAPAGQLADK
jgi:hypothetical protein